MSKIQNFEMLLTKKSNGLMYSIVKSQTLWKKSSKVLLFFKRFQIKQINFLKKIGSSLSLRQGFLITQKTIHNITISVGELR